MGGVFCLALAACAMSATGRAEENWSRFRGPNGAGVAAGVSFPAVLSEPSFAWKVALPGAGHSSPVAWGERVFVTAADRATAAVTLACLDAASGDTRWTKTFESEPHHLHAANSFATSTPAADQRHVYVAWVARGALHVAALTHDGEQAWRRELGPVEYQHGFGGSPMVVDGLVIVANDHAGESWVAALDAASGEPRWRVERGGGVEAYATPAVWQTNDGSRQLIVNSTAEGMTALSLADGRVAWQLPGVFRERCVGSPFVAGGMIIATSGQGGSGKSFLAVRPPTGPSDKPEIAYELKASIPQSPTPVAAGELLFVWADRGVVSCYDLATGAAHWSERIGGTYYGSPVIAGGTLYGVSADGEVVALAASKAYELLGRTPLGEPSHATPMIHHGRLFVRTESSLVCVASGQR